MTTSDSEDSAVAQDNDDSNAQSPEPGADSHGESNSQPSTSQPKVCVAVVSEPITKEKCLCLLCPVQTHHHYIHTLDKFIWQPDHFIVIMSTIIATCLTLMQIYEFTMLYTGLSERCFHRAAARCTKNHRNGWPAA